MTHPYRIGLVVLHAEPARGGAERYTFDLAHALANRGHQVDLIASTPAAVAAPVRMVTLPTTALTRTGRYQQFLTLLERQQQLRGYDILHAALPVTQCDIYHPHAGLATLAVKQGHRKHSGWRRAWSALATQFNSRRQRFAQVETRLMRTAAPLVLSVSEYAAAANRQAYPSAQHRSLFNAVDLQRFDPDVSQAEGKAWRAALGIPASAHVAVMMAQNFVLKGLPTALVALAQMQRPDCHLVVLGKPDPTPWRARAAALGLSPQVHFPGPTRQPAACYAGADLCLLPTVHDQCSLVVLEALAMGLPVITTRNNGAHEIMTEGVHGAVLSDPGDATALAQAWTAWTDPQRLASGRQAALALRPRLSAAQHVDALLEIYRSVIAARAADHSQGRTGASGRIAG